MKKLFEEESNKKINADDIYELFAIYDPDKIEDFIGNGFSTVTSNGEVNNVQVHNDENNSLENNDENNSSENNVTLSDDKLKERIKDFFALFITNDTIKYIKELYNNYNKEKNFDGLKIEAIKNSYNAIKDAEERLNIYNNQEKKNISKKDIKNQFASTIRKAIVGIKEGEYTKRRSLQNEKSFEGFWSDHKNDLDNKLNLLKYLTPKEWDEFRYTLEYPFIEKTNAKGSEDDTINTKSVVQRLKVIVEKATFDSKIPSMMLKFIESLKNECSGNIVPYTSHFYPFGKRRLNIFDGVIKRTYMDCVKNSQAEYNGVRLFDIYRMMPYEDFWKNTCVISCYTNNTYNTITSMIYQLNRRNELNMTSTGNLTTNLKTRSILFIMNKNVENVKNVKNDKNDIKELLTNRNGEALFTDKNLVKFGGSFNSTDEKIISLINRYYFVLITEGYFKVGNTLSKIGNVGKKIITSLSNYNRL